MPRPKADDPVLQKLRQQGRIKGEKTSRSLETILAEQGIEVEGKGVKEVLKGSKYGNKVVKKSDPRNPYGVTFGSEGEFAFALALDEAGIPNEKQVNLGKKNRPGIGGVELKDYKITIDFFLPELNVYVDYKGKITERALWQFRLLTERFETQFPNPGDRPYICTVGAKNYNEFITLAKKRGRFYLAAFVFDAK